jgi:hypothetical protein
MRLRVPSESAAVASGRHSAAVPGFQRILKCDGAGRPAVPDPDTVARALARLANGNARERTRERADEDPRRVVGDAAAAMERVATAAAFVDDGGERELRRAVEAAESGGDDEVASRGRRVLRTLSRFRDAAAAESSAGLSGEAAGTTSTPLAQRSSREGS